jgi:hypothetical protein
MVAARTSTEDMWGEAVRLPDSINGLPCVSHPTVTGDGLELYFSSIDTPGQDCRWRYADIFVSRRATRVDAWQEPKLVKSNAHAPGISSDGLRLFFLAGSSDERANAGLPVPTFGDGIRSVFVGTRNSRDEEFGPGVELADPPNSSGTSLAVWGPEPSSDGSTLYFSSNRAGAPTEFGVWQSTVTEPCDINGDGSCDVDDLTRREFFARNLQEGSDRPNDITNYDSFLQNIEKAGHRPSTCDFRLQVNQLFWFWLRIKWGQANLVLATLNELHFVISENGRVK